MLYSYFINSTRFFQKENTMNYRLLFIINALVVLVFGVGYLVVPVVVLKQFGTETTVPVQIVARFFGSALLGLGLVLWFAKDVTDETVQRNFGYALLGTSVVGLILAIYGSASSQAVIRTNAWIPILLYALFALGYGYLIFLKPRMTQ
jgi:hypothetical protein